MIRTAFLFIAAGLGLAACGSSGDSQPLEAGREACYNCIATPASEALTPSQVASLRLIHGGGLPIGVSSVYYAEQCGIDCLQQIRFDTTERDAVALATRLLPDVVAQSVRPDDVPTGTSDQVWWTTRPDTASRQYRGQGGQGWPITIMVYSMGGERAQVFLSANQM